MGGRSNKPRKLELRLLQQKRGRETLHAVYTKYQSDEVGATRGVARFSIKITRLRERLGLGGSSRGLFLQAL